ncbi:mitochondrial 37S ribosomal protein rsm10 [Cladochytrium tenue]|nr:mitochondrial 37S ribosomal protein rsm10 [Cladochytrium tenue]
MPDHAEFVSYFARYAAHVRRIPTSERIIHLATKTEKWHVTRGPFVHDKTKDVFERKTYRRLIQLFNADDAVVDDWVSYVNSNLPAGIDMKVERFEWVEFEGLAEQLNAEAEKESAEATRIEELTKSPTPVEPKGDGQKTAEKMPPRTRPLGFAEDVRVRAQAYVDDVMKQLNKK